jgi:hypothetical protein
MVATHYATFGMCSFEIAQACTGAPYRDPKTGPLEREMSDRGKSAAGGHHRVISSEFDSEKTSMLISVKYDEGRMTQ